MATKPRQKRDETVLIDSLARGETVAESARLSGFSDRTVHRRLEDRAFCEQVSQARAAMFDSAAAKMSAAMDSAIDTLKELLEADSESVQLSAARSIIEHAVRLRELNDHEKRLAELERIVNEHR
ncbi:MAG: hypothetical protein DWQ34_11190 [Planctomycetota bacterium]|nr:MAG: hypothetical protein DWQ34_11190 [Planctomycetota bacterium]REK29717.1 MAG: hypothetical protein DWQ41_03510 [Planctomycetota bacterium]REK30462.1 MAG: hypothetical protein DWQ45_21525 [Planctomycetota bacterium]